MSLILTINSGSSSLKFAVYDGGKDGETRVAGGTLARIGAHDSTATMTGAEGARDDRPTPLPDHTAAVDWLMAYLERGAFTGRLAAVAHRLVHGGLHLHTPVQITSEIRRTLETLIPFAPNHLPDALCAVDRVAHWAPTLPQIAAFDTAFHREMPRAAQLYGLPRALADEGLIRYGFHGLSYEYIVSELRRRHALGARTIIAHLGNGASLAAIRDGRSIDTSMGLTPAGGLVMSTRSGDVDPEVVLYLLRHFGCSPSEVAELVNEKGGLLGISETSGDMQDLLDLSASDPRVAEAIAVFCYQVRKYIGAYAAALGGLDTLVFTGGIGEQEAIIRSRICEDLGHLGIHIDEEANAAGHPQISRPEASVTVWVIPTNEELMLARHARAVLTSLPAKIH